SRSIAGDGARRISPVRDGSPPGNRAGSSAGGGTLTGGEAGRGVPTSGVVVQPAAATSSTPRRTGVRRKKAGPLFATLSGALACAAPFRRAPLMLEILLS